ncbi:MAG TPA: hypothetical protein PLL33_12695, partial [Paracoccus sp. (in: a-proteobacteria)]|nr:hypothetical protein [Paracoccus sp. (in: a-proteobacteria)]
MMRGLYALPAGVDFAAEVVAGLRTHLAGRPPEDMARVTLYANDGHSLRALRTELDRGGALLLPQMRLLADLGADLDGPAPAAPLARRLELAR